MGYSLNRYTYPALLPDFPFSNIWNEAIRLITNIGHVDSLKTELKEDVKQVTSNFRKIANEASGMLRGYLKQARLSVDDQDRLLIVLPDEISASVVGSEEHKQELKDLIEKKIGKTVEIDVRQVENGRHFEDSFVDIEKVINMEITIEDE